MNLKFWTKKILVFFLVEHFSFAFFAFDSNYGRFSPANWHSPQQKLLPSWREKSNQLLKIKKYCLPTKNQKKLPHILKIIIHPNLIPMVQKLQNMKKLHQSPVKLPFHYYWIENYLVLNHYYWVEYFDWVLNSAELLHAVEIIYVCGRAPINALEY